MNRICMTDGFDFLMKDNEDKKQWVFESSIKNLHKKMFDCEGIAGNSLHE